MSGPVELKREKGKLVIRDDAAGYYRVLEWTELTRLLEQAATLNHLANLCEGKIPKRD